MPHYPRKRFGQNFLQDHLVIDSILRAFHPAPNDHVLEIGPGLGALTQPLLEELDHLIAIEIDRNLHDKLLTLSQARNKLELITEDALNVDYDQLGPNLRIIGNLPYNISTPLIIHLLHHVSQIDEMLFMLQKEVVDRLVAPPSCKSYGRLSVIVQYYCEAECLFHVPAEAFYPKPKVESAVIRLTPHRPSPYQTVPFEALERLLASAFSMRRKTLANNLKTILPASQISQQGVDPTKRPEQIEIKEFAQLAKFINR